ncbi:hypothetical protein A0J57_18140 [Sphingobium sp. 22B]|uniref:hypothetical protein n=1 Tax=unclassified Sphingobium TaxID=2611147 RepID=UPI0007838C04|nr:MULTISPECIES: hypothetical protein [unclassified Sphingobium]KXU29942.1 hypothetical protein AXW74_20400 [Sphingobium sp. AM]KYC30912.1 hypothetical protein A0J57_18140 [Sphingobium sp. 22B]OAP30444.1 hypothetical protein A8O16_18430 [Sphingobium sp. 20006FA]
MGEPERLIVIMSAPPGFRVQVQPPVEGEDLDADLPDYRRARGWAGGLRMSRGWRVIDRTGERA